MSEINDWPGGLTRDEWLAYWKDGNVSYKADDLCIDDLRNDLAFAVEQISVIPALVEALQGILDDDASTTSLADQRARWESRMEAARAALAKARGA